MMKCAKASKYVGAFVDDEIDGWWLKRAFVRHWRKCRMCQRLVEIQREMKDLLQTKCAEQKAPDQLRDKIHDLLDKNQRTAKI